MAYEDGGAAFPEGVACDSFGGINFSRERGLTVRDYFAAKALAALVIVRCNANATTYAFDELAWQSYQFADAMLKERQK